MIEDYIPIYVVSVNSKIIEKVVHTYLKNNVINDDKFRIRRLD